MQRVGGSRGKDKSIIMSEARNRNTVLGISFFFRLLDLVCKLDNAVVKGFPLFLEDYIPIFFLMPMYEKKNFFMLSSGGMEVPALFKKQSLKKRI